MINFVWLYDIVLKVINLSHYLFSQLTHIFVLPDISFIGIVIINGFSFSLWQAILGSGGGLILIIVLLRIIKALVPVV